MAEDLVAARHPEFKTCTQCRQAKIKSRANFFHQWPKGGRKGRKPSSYRGFRQPCLECVSANNKAAKDRERIAKGLPITRRGKALDLERKRAASKAWRDRNKEYLAERAKGRRARDPEKHAAYVLRQSRRRYAQIRADPTLVLHYKISRGVWKSLRTGKNGRGWESLLGYTAEELRRHIERQFTSGMSWDALLAGKIHIDHIRPKSQFVFSSCDDPQFHECWAITNLRPMWAPANIKKGNKRIYLI